jgi:hypothetical protein
MAVGEYNVDDVQGGVIDAIVKFIVVVGSFAGLIALVWILGYGIKKFKGLAK